MCLGYSSVVEIVANGENLLGEIKILSNPYIEKNMKTEFLALIKFQSKIQIVWVMLFVKFLMEDGAGRERIKANLQMILFLLIFLMRI